jgi:hypothetical protein
VTDLASSFTRTTVTDPGGAWTVSGFSSGTLRVTVESAGFNRYVQQFNYVSSQPQQFDIALQVGSTADSVIVTGSLNTLPMSGRPISPPPPPPPAAAAPSSAVLELKQKVVGVLPIAIDIPRTGTSYRFVKPLVIDEEATVTFVYRTK